MYEEDDATRHKPAYDAPEEAPREEGFRAYVGNVHFEADERVLQEAFGKFGTLIKTQIIKDYDGRSKGFGFVVFADEEAMQTAIAEMNGRELEGRTIKVNKALPRGERQTFDRGYGDRGYGGDRDYPPRGERSYRGGRGGDMYGPRGGYGGRGEGYGRYDGGYRPQKPAGYRVGIQGLHPDCDWRVLKDFLKAAGEVTYAAVRPDGSGIGDFVTENGRQKALVELQGQSFEGGTSIRLKPLERPPPSQYDDGYSRGGPDRSYNSGGYGGGDRGYDRGYSQGSGRDYNGGGGYGGGAGGYGGGSRGGGGYDKGYDSYDKGYGSGGGGGYGGGHGGGGGDYGSRGAGGGGYPRGEGGYGGGYGSSRGGGGGYEGGYGASRGGGYDDGYGGGSRGSGGGGGYDRRGGAGYDREPPPRREGGYSGGGGYGGPPPSRAGPDRGGYGARGGYERAAPY